MNFADTKAFFVVDVSEEKENCVTASSDIFWKYTYDY